MKTCRSCQSANLDRAVACSVCGETLDDFTIIPSAPSAAPSGYAAPSAPPGYAPPSGYDTPTPPGYAPPPAAPAPPGYGPPAGYAPPPQATVYAPPGAPGGYVHTAPTDNMAITSLVLSLVATVGMFACFFPIVLAPAGAITGHVALNRIKRSGQSGRGLALAGVIVGWLGTLAGLAIVVLFVALFAASGPGY